MLICSRPNCEDLFSYEQEYIKHLHEKHFHFLCEICWCHNPSKLEYDDHKKTHTQIEIDAVTLNLELERQLDYLKCRTVWIRGKVNDSSKRMLKLINELKDSNKNNQIELQFEKFIDCLQYEQEFLHYYANLDGASPNGDNRINFPTRFTKKIPNILDD